MYTRTTDWAMLQTIPKTRTFRTEYAKTEKNEHEMRAHQSTERVE